MRFCFSLFLLCTLISNASAGDKVPVTSQPGWLAPVSPDLNIVPPSREINNGFYYILMDEQTNLVNNTTYTHFIKKIVNESGIQDESEISVRFSPAYEQLTFHTAVIIRDGHRINQLLPAAIKVVQEETDVQDYQYNGEKRAYITLTDVRKNDQIEVAYSLTGVNPVFGKKYSTIFDFNYKSVICNYYKTYITTPDRKLLIRTVNGAPAPEEHLEGGRYIYRWTNPVVKDYMSISGAPSWYRPWQEISLTEFHGWGDVVGWGLGIFNNYRYPLPAELKKMMAAWEKTAAGDKDRFANLAAHFVQDEVRYLGLEIGVNSHQPHNPAETFNRRFGDCKDKTLLLTTILREEGIQAYAALISTDLEDHLAESLPSPIVFDHVIVAIPRPGNKYLFIDPTISSQGGEMTSRSLPAYGASLLLKPGDTSLTTVNQPMLHKYDIQEIFDITMHDSSKISVTATYSGGAADNMRSVFAGNSMKDVEEYYLKHYSQNYTDVYLQDSLRYEDDLEKNNLTVRSTYIVPRIFSTSEKESRETMPFTARALTNMLPEPPGKGYKNAPLALDYPRTVNYSVTFEMPKEWGFSSTELHVKNDCYQFDFVPAVSGSTITAHYFFRTFKSSIPAEELTQYKKDYEAIWERLNLEFYSSLTSPSHREPATSIDTVTIIESWGKPFFPAIWLTFFFAMLASWGFRKLNRRTAFTQHYGHRTGYPIGGWTIVLGVCMISGGCWQLVTFLKSGYYSAAHWEELGAAGGMPLRCLVYADLFYSLLTISGVAAVSYWFVKKRDIFPSMFTWYIAILVGGQLALLFGTLLIPANTFRQGHMSELSIQFIRTFIYGSVWITYVQRSEQVKNTFINGPW